MTTASFPDRGEPSEWAELNGEETRCLLGLKLYYTTPGLYTESGESEIGALQMAWEDLKREFPRLEPFKWYKQGGS
jgi:hypothetical protein